MRYPAKKEHPLVYRLEEARWFHQQGFNKKAQGMLNRICADLEKKEKDIAQEDNDPDGEVMYGSNSRSRFDAGDFYGTNYRYNPADWH